MWGGKQQNGGVQGRGRTGRGKKRHCPGEGAGRQEDWYAKKQTRRLREYAKKKKRGKKRNSRHSVRGGTPHRTPKRKTGPRWKGLFSSPAHMEARTGEKTQIVSVPSSLAEERGQVLWVNSRFGTAARRKIMEKKHFLTLQIRKKKTRKRKAVNQKERTGSSKWKSTGDKRCSR